MAVSRISLSLAAAALALAGGMAAAKNPMVGGAAMLETKTIVENAGNSKDHTTLVAAVKAAGVAETLSSAGPFTVFAPTNAAFEKIPAETLQGLLTPEQRDTLTAVLTYHVVSGRVDAATLIEQIQAGGGSATVTTVQGGELTARVVEGGVVLTDAAGNESRVVQTDVTASNGVIHAIDTVVMPG